MSRLVLKNGVAEIHSIFVVEFLVELLFVDDAHCSLCLMDVEHKSFVEFLEVHSHVVIFDVDNVVVHISVANFLLKNMYLLIIDVVVAVGCGTACHSCCSCCCCCCCCLVVALPILRFLSLLVPLVASRGATWSVVFVVVVVVAPVVVSLGTTGAAAVAVAVVVVVVVVRYL